MLYLGKLIIFLRKQFIHSKYVEIVVTKNKCLNAKIFDLNTLNCLRTFAQYLMLVHSFFAKTNSFSHEGMHLI